jgi:hypothetical protein
MHSTTRQELVKRLFPPAAHLSPISLMEFTHLLFQLFLSPFRCLCAFLGRPLMTNLRDSTAALSNDRTNLTGNYARSFEGEPSSNKQLHPAFREDTHPHRPRARFCYSFQQLPQLLVLTQADADRAGRSRSPYAGIRPSAPTFHSPRTAFATSTRSAVFPFCTAVSFCSTSHIRSPQHVRTLTASAAFHSPITCHGVSSLSVQQEHDEESSLPKRRCSNSLQAKSPHMNFTSRTRSNTPFLAQIFRMSPTSGSGLCSTTVTTLSSWCRRGRISARVTPRTALSTRQPLFLSYYNAAKKLAPLISYLLLSIAPKFLSWDFLINGHPLYARTAALWWALGLCVQRLSSSCAKNLILPQSLLIFPASHFKCHLPLARPGLLEFLASPPAKKHSIEIDISCLIGTAVAMNAPAVQWVVSRSKAN